LSFTGVLFPERATSGVRPFGGGGEGGGGGGGGGIAQVEQTGKTQCRSRRGEERCLRESDGPFDVMYVQRRRNGAKGETLLSAVYERNAHIACIGYYYTRTHKSEQTPGYYPAH